MKLRSTLLAPALLSSLAFASDTPARVAVDWAQTSSDWAKTFAVIVPSLCTAAVALLVARWGRSHDFEKERRRRKQDFLFAAAEKQEQLRLTMSNVFNSHIWYLRFKASGDPLDALSPDALLEHVKASGEAEKEFSLIETKIELLGLPGCLEAFGNHRKSTFDLKFAVAEVVKGRADKESLEAAYARWEETDRRLRQQLVAAFKTL